MMKSSEGSERLSCAEAALLRERLLLEESISEQEQNSLFHHLNHCPECHEIDTVMSGLPQYKDALTDDGLRSMVGAVKTAYFNEKKNKRWIQSAVIVAGTAAAAVLLMIFPPKKLGDEPPAPTFAETCRPSAPVTTVPGVRLTHCDGSAPRIEIAPNGDVTFSIEKGAVGIAADPRRSPKAAVAVRTPFGEVRVKGTIFTVRVDKNDARVEVFRGTVEVVPETDKVTSYAVSRGRGAYLQGGSLFDLALSGETEVLHRGLNLTVARNESATLEPSTSNHEETEKTEETDTFKTEDITSHPTSFIHRTVPSLETFIREAHDCLLTHDWPCAAARYQGILKHYPGQPEAVTALISLAGIELRRLGRPHQALTHYKAYQRRAPNGPLAEEALFGTAEAYRRLGISDRETEALRRFIERYPGSLKTGEARKRLSQLENAK